jgi:outer membrane lipoprotein carrier protein
MYKLCLIILLLPAVLYSQEDKAAKLLKAVQDKFNGIEDLSADIKQTTGGKKNLIGKIFYKNKNKFNLDLANLNIVSDGSTVWNYNKKENKVIINEYDESDPSALSLNEIINEYPKESSIKYESSNGKDILVVAPKPVSDLNFERAKLWINKNNLVEKISIERAGIGETVIELSNYKLNQDLPNKRFTFIPPEGSTIIDLR